MKSWNVLQLLMRSRYFIKETMDMMVTFHENLGNLQEFVSNHIIHRLNDQDERLERMENKLDKIGKKLNV